MRLCLVMIVRDESHCIARTLESVRDHVDGWCVVDTGSSDGTQEIVRDSMAGIPGTLHELPFVDFATTRNAAIGLARGDATHLLMLDADDVLVDGSMLRLMLTLSSASAFQLAQHWPEGIAMVTRVIRADSGWRYRGRVHEDLVLEGASPTGLVGPRLLHDAGELGNAKSRARLPRDVEVLREMIAEDPGDERARFYLARTLSMLGQ